jgi:hypothetical protein
MNRQELIDFLDTIRDYERESHTMLAFDERESGEIVDIYLSTTEQKQEKSCDSCVGGPMV